MIFIVWLAIASVLVFVATAFAVRFNPFARDIGLFRLTFRLLGLCSMVSAWLVLNVVVFLGMGAAMFLSMMAGSVRTYCGRSCDSAF